MIRLALTTLTALACLAGCRTSSPPGTSLPAARTSRASADICAVRSPCSDIPPPTDEEVAACVAVFDDASPCRDENAALLACSLGATRCTDSGALDEAASLEALEAACREVQSDFERCCEGVEESLHCELLETSDEGEPDASEPRDLQGPPSAEPATGETTT